MNLEVAATNQDCRRRSILLASVQVINGIPIRSGVLLRNGKPLRSGIIPKSGILLISGILVKNGKVAKIGEQKINGKMRKSGTIMMEQSGIMTMIVGKVEAKGEDSSTAVNEICNQKCKKGNH